MKTKMKKRIALLLACLFVICPLALTSCGGSQDSGADDGGDRGADGSWDSVDFGGATVTMCVSANQDQEVTFPAADIYTKGPDQTTTEEVQKKVLARNERVAKTLNLNVVFTTRDLWYNKILDDISKLVQGAAEDAPDIYNNDMYGLTRAMAAGYLWNLSNPGKDAAGNDVKSYFDFTQEGWNYEFMKGATLDQSKLYILAGDYFLDMIRMAWVLYVNVPMFNENAKSLDYEDINQFYEYVDSGIWDYDMLRDICRKIWQDTGDVREMTDKKDGRIGLVINHVSSGIFMYSTGFGTYYQDESGTPHVIEDINELTLIGNAYRSIYSTEGNVTTTGAGILYDYEVLSSTEHFMDNNVLFAHSVLGELESPDMRNLTFQKGLVPVPKYDEQRQDSYHTMVHDQVELGAILNNAKSFGRASAYLQMLNEESADIVHEYYEKGLKFKYSEDKGIRTMIDLVYNTIDTPFNYQMSAVINETASTVTLKGLITGILQNTLASIYAAERDVYVVNLQKALESFAKIA